MRGKFRILVLCFFNYALVGCIGALEESSPSQVVTTDKGDVQGRTKFLHTGAKYDEFLGIPYGAPPVDDKRFTKTRPPAAWNGTLQAVEYGNKCVQIIDPAGREDCLYVNVFVPGGLDSDRDPLPVMVWSYGGAFVIGSSNQYPGQGLAVNAKVIVVTYNYRVGPFGGLSTGDQWSPGNYYLWDAQAAFTWVKNNIRAFGGDPTRVTAIGQSAGGALSSHFVTSPKMRGLFQRVIAMSGASTAMFGTAYKNTEIAKNLGTASLCLPLGNKALVKCLRAKKAKALDYNSYIAGIVLGQRMPAWLPVVDGDAVPKHPREAMEDGVGGDVDLMIGYTHDDGAGMIYLNPFGMPGMNYNLAANAFLLDQAMALMLRPFGDAKQLINIIKDQYPDMRSEDVLTRTKAAAQVLTDWGFGSPTHLEATRHAKNAAQTGRNTYHYDFHYRQSFQHYVDWVNGSHVDDVWSLLGEDFFRNVRELVMGNFSDTDKLVSKYINSYYGNFAYTGNPNKGPHTVPTFWPKFNASASLYMEQNEVMEVKAISADLQRRYNFWTETWPNLTDPVNYISEDTTLGATGFGGIFKEIINHITKYVQQFNN